MRNTELFNRIADRIEKDPDTYNQHEWGCGTKFCVAGHVAVELGCKSSGVNSFGDPIWSLIITPSGHRMATHDFARERLGLDDDDAYELFDAGWLPRDGGSVPDALRAIGRGEEI